VFGEQYFDCTPSAKCETQIEGIKLALHSSFSDWYKCQSMKTTHNSRRGVVTAKLRVTSLNSDDLVTVRLSECILPES
jgi:hypothetical protein